VEKEPKFEKKPAQSRESIEADKKPIADIELDEKTLEFWEEIGLKDDISDLIFGFKELVPVGERFVLHGASFESTGLSDAYKLERLWEIFNIPPSKELEEAIEGLENEVRKSILAFTFKELEIDPENPEIVKEKTIKEEDKELLVRYFKTNQPHTLLGYDTIDWWLERERKKKKKKKKNPIK
jgi:hypothetical protein